MLPPPLWIFCETGRTTQKQCGHRLRTATQREDRALLRITRAADQVSRSVQIRRIGRGFAIHTAQRRLVAAGYRLRPPARCARLTLDHHRRHRKRAPGPRFNIKMSSYQYRKSHCGDKTVVRSSYLHNGISYTGEMSSLYWIRAQSRNRQHWLLWFLLMSRGSASTTVFVDVLMKG